MPAAGKPRPPSNPNPPGMVHLQAGIAHEHCLATKAQPLRHGLCIPSWPVGGARAAGVWIRPPLVQAVVAADPSRRAQHTTQLDDSHAIPHDSCQVRDVGNRSGGPILVGSSDHDGLWWLWGLGAAVGVTACSLLQSHEQGLDAGVEVVGGLGSRDNGDGAAVVGARVGINRQVVASEPDDVHGVGDLVVRLKAVQDQRPVAIVGGEVHADGTCQSV